MKIIHVIASIDPKHGGLQALRYALPPHEAGLGLGVNIVSYGDAAIEAQVKKSVAAYRISRISAGISCRRLSELEPVLL
ncbi:MAG: hypothetical protein U5L46_07460 [Agrobacterium sp.]|nr:hypothetical protein [Agrobacterium sp.]